MRSNVYDPDIAKPMVLCWNLSYEQVNLSRQGPHNSGENSKLVSIFYLPEYTEQVGTLPAL